MGGLCVLKSFTRISEVVITDAQPKKLICMNGSVFLSGSRRQLLKFMLRRMCKCVFQLEELKLCSAANCYHETGLKLVGSNLLVDEPTNLSPFDLKLWLKG